MDKIEKKEDFSLEAILKTKELKDYSLKGEVQQVKLLKVEQVKTSLKKLATKYKDLEITEDNIKDVGIQAERELRQSRLEIQRIHNSNKAVLNNAKKKEKEIVDELIAIIKPIEDKLKEQINAINEKKEEERRLKKEAEIKRVADIKDRLHNLELAFEKQVNQCSSEDELENYDNELEALKNDFASFEEFEFEAKRIHAIYLGKRKDVLIKIEESKKEKLLSEIRGKELAFERMLNAANTTEAEAEFLEELKSFKDNLVNYEIVKTEAKKVYDYYKEASKTIKDKINNLLKEKEEEEKRKEKEEEMKALKNQVCDFRKGLLIEKGFEYEKELNALKNNKIKSVVYIEDLKEQDSKEWKEFLKETEAKIKQFEIDKRTAEDIRKQNVLNAWNELLKEYKSIGGDVKKWKKEDITEEDIEALTKDIQDFKWKQNKEKLEKVKKEIDPFKNEVLEFLKNLEIKVDNKKFVHEESKSILTNLIAEFESITNDVLGEVLNN